MGSNEMRLQEGSKFDLPLLLALAAALAVTNGDNLALESQVASAQVAQPSSSCRTVYQQVSIVKQVPSFAKHCTKVDDTKCKTVFKNSISTSMETQCVPTFDTNCDTTLETAYKQECRTITDVECRIVNLDSGSRKICEDVPTEKCVPVPVKVEGQSCVNVPTQKCESVPVQASNPVPTKQCYKKPRQVCQTLVSAKPKVVTAKIPKQICGHSSEFTKRKTNPTKSSKSSRPVSSMSAKEQRLMEGWEEEGERSSRGKKSRAERLGSSRTRGQNSFRGNEQIV